ncbi:SH2 domain protein [Ostertagia ostertagi]
MDRALEKTLADLEKEEWYHGHLPYEDIVGLMKNDGDFLLRGLEPEGDHHAMVCLSVKWEGKVRDFPVHYMLRNNERVYTLDGTVQSNDIMELVKYYLSSAKPAYEAILKKPICKQPWELTIDKIRMVQIVGTGAFGEVWRGTMQEGPSKPPVDVAIKMVRFFIEETLREGPAQIISSL